PEAVPPRRAADAGGARPGAADPRRLPRLASAAVAARDGRGDRDRPAHVPDLSAHRGGGAPPVAARVAGGRRGAGDRRGRARLASTSNGLVRAGRGPARPGRRRAAPGPLAGQHPALAVRLVPLASGPDATAVRIRLHAGGVHARSETDARLLFPADLPRRPSHRPARPEGAPWRAPARGERGAFRAVVRARRAPARRRVGRARSRRRPRRPGRLHPLARDLHRRRHGVGGTGRAVVAARAAHAPPPGIIWERESEPMTVTRILLLAVFTSISVLGAGAGAPAAAFDGEPQLSLMVPWES